MSTFRGEAHKLRLQVNDKVTKDEFRRMVDRTATQLRTVEERLDEHDEEIEKLKVLQEDVKNKTENSTSANYFLRRGEGYQADGKPYKAAACYGIAIRLAPTDSSLHLKRCQFYVAIGAAAVGVADAIEAIRLDPKSIPAYHSRSLGYLAEGSFGDAVADLTKALALDPTDPSPIYATRGSAYYHSAKYNLAIADCGDSIRKSPNSLAYRTRAMSLTALKDFSKADADASEAVRLEPKNADNFFACAEARVGLGEFKKVVADAEVAIRLAPKSANTWV